MEGFFQLRFLTKCTHIRKSTKHLIIQILDSSCKEKLYGKEERLV